MQPFVRSFLQYLLQKPSLLMNGRANFDIVVDICLIGFVQKRKHVCVLSNKNVLFAKADFSFLINGIPVKSPR